MKKWLPVLIGVAVAIYLVRRQRFAKRLISPIKRPDQLPL